MPQILLVTCFSGQCILGVTAMAGDIYMDDFV